MNHFESDLVCRSHVPGHDFGNCKILFVLEHQSFIGVFKSRQLPRQMISSNVDVDADMDGFAVTAKPEALHWFAGPSMEL